MAFVAQVENVATSEKLGQLVVSGPYSTDEATVRIIRKWLWWYRVEATVRTHLSGYERYLEPGRRAWVPIRAIRRLRVVEAESEPSPQP
jgi:hypothetical protein